MTFIIQLQYEAVEDVQKIFMWYESKKIGLGYEFIESFEKTYTKLISSANYFDYIDKLKRYRRALLERFPCMVIYEIENNNVIIVAVRYSAENPSKYEQFVR